MKRSAIRKRLALKRIPIMVLVLVLAGCQSAATSEGPNGSGSTEEPEHANVAIDSPQKSYLANVRSGELPAPVHSGTGEEEGAHTESQSGSPDGEAASSPSGNPAAWNAANPTLAGLAIGDSEVRIGMLLGEPSDTYTLQDDADSIEVREYGGFAVGINRDAAVQYIEVYDSKVATGLNGLRVGDQPESAVDILGKPDTQTTFILTYEAEGAFLKLDLDPSSNTIVSIKLLAQS